jgi:toxin CcdB
LPQARAKTPVKGLNPSYEVGDDRFVVITQEIAVMPKQHLRARVGSLSDHHDEILRALDILFTGF